MRVLVVPAANDTSALLRLLWPADALRAAGHDVVSAGLDWRLRTLVDDADHVREIRELPDCDVLVLQRVQSRRLAEAIPLLQAAGVAVVVDLDDDLAAVHPANSAWKSIHPASSPDSNWHHLLTACRHADLVTVTTRALARVYAPHGRVAVLPNRLPEIVARIEHVEGRPLRVGWPGRVDTHPNDLQVTRGAVGRAVEECGAVFVNVGPGGAAHALGVAGEELSTGMVNISQWYATIAANVDVGIVPLAESRFNNAKSGLKVLEMASVGIPTVASPTPDNVRLHTLGMGVLAAKPKDWERQLRRLLTDDVHRQAVAAGAQNAARHESLERHAADWWAAWSSAALDRVVA